MKLRKLVALVSAAVLSLSLGMTAFATESREYNANQVFDDKDNKVKVDVTSIDDEKVEAFLNNPTSVTKVLESVIPEMKEGVYGDAEKDLHANVSVIYKGEFNLYDAEGKAIELDQAGLEANAAGKYDVRVPLDTAAGIPDFEGMSTEDLAKYNENPLNVYVMHQVTGEDGTQSWEVISAVVRYSNGLAYAEVGLTSLSPIAVVKVMPNGTLYAKEYGAGVAPTDANALGVATNAKVVFTVADNGAVDIQTSGSNDNNNNNNNNNNGDNNTNNGNGTTQKPADSNKKPAASTAVSTNKSPKTGE